MNGGGARCGVEGGEGARRFVHRALRIDAQLGGGGEAGEGWRGVGAVGQVGSRRRRREVGDGPDAWGRSVSERREGEGEAGRRWLLGRKSELGLRPTLVGGEK
jgi:hypothetical protein